MPIVDINAMGALAWELDNPSTRVSMHLITKWAPIDVTLSTPGTAETLFTADTEPPIVNLITNPSMETGTPPTGYTASGATLLQSATTARSGTNSLSIDPDNSVAGEGAYWTTDEMAGHPDPGKWATLVASIYLEDNVDVGRTARIEIRNEDGTTTHATGNEITLTSSWQRSTAFFPLPATGATYRIYIVTSTSASDEVFFADDFMLSLQRDQVDRAYCDGDVGLNYEWVGTAHASRSVKRHGLVAIRAFNLHTTLDARVAFNHTASASLGVYMPAGSDWWQDKVHFNDISFINDISGQQPRIGGSVLGVHTTKSSD